jgi:hypothetical protein
MALRNQEQLGIWGGTNGRERRRIRQQQEQQTASDKFLQHILERRNTHEHTQTPPQI